MRFYGAKRRFVLWMASVAVLFAALLPTLTAARPTPPDWSQICTAHGSVVANVGQISGDSRSSQPGGDPLFEHCPYCSLHGVVPGMLPLALVGPTLLLTATKRGAYIAAAPTLRLWSDALSRAPPVV